MEYRKGLYLNVMNPQSAERNKQSIITVRGEGIEVNFKQIAVWQDDKCIPCACISTFCLCNRLTGSDPILVQFRVRSEWATIRPELDCRVVV